MLESTEPVVRTSSRQPQLSVSVPLLTQDVCDSQGYSALLCLSRRQRAHTATAHGVTTYVAREHGKSSKRYVPGDSGKPICQAVILEAVRFFSAASVPHPAHLATSPMHGCSVGSQLLNPHWPFSPPHKRQARPKSVVVLQRKYTKYKMGSDGVVCPWPLASWAATNRLTCGCAEEAINYRRNGFYQRVKPCKVNWKAAVTSLVFMIP